MLHTGGDGRQQLTFQPGPIFANLVLADEINRAPAKKFWSFVVYSGQHWSLLETDQKSEGVDINNPNLKPNADGSYTFWFGPKLLQQKENQIR